MAADELPTGDKHDFDFLAGTWAGENRRLKKRWVGSDDWDVFPGNLRCALHMDGLVNVEEVVFPTKGFTGMAVRLFDHVERRWSIYWINSERAVFYPPMRGGFTGDHGVFFGEEPDDGQLVKVQFRWTRRGRDSARWEQAFSRDGTSWEWNWSCDFTRTGN